MALPERPTDPAQVLETMLAGNHRFATGEPAHPNQDAVHRARAAQGQSPFAVVLGCSDSRVAAEIVFDCGLGDLFVVRTAGHLLGAEVLASIEFAITALHTPVIVVLGHDRCGAITAALDAHHHGTSPPGHLRVITERILPEIRTALARDITDHDAIGALHITSTCDQLVEQSPLVADRLAANQLAVIGMTYALAEGRVRAVVSEPSC